MLVKTPVSVPGTLRTDQYVRAQVIWTHGAGLTVPLTAVTRINGQWFRVRRGAGEGGKGLVARQRRCSSGRSIGNNYIVVERTQAGRES